MIRVGRRVLGPYAGVPQQFCDDCSRALQDLAALPVNGLQQYTPRINATYPGLDAGFVDEVRQAFQTAGLLMSANTVLTDGLPVIRRSFTPRPGVPRELSEDMNRLFQTVHGQFTPGEVRRVSIVRAEDATRTTEMTIPDGAASVVINITGSTFTDISVFFDNDGEGGGPTDPEIIIDGDAIHVPDDATTATATIPEDEGVTLEWIFTDDVVDPDPDPDPPDGDPFTLGTCTFHDGELLYVSKPTIDVQSEYYVFPDVMAALETWVNDRTERVGLPWTGTYWSHVETAAAQTVPDNGEWDFSLERRAIYNDDLSEDFEWRFELVAIATLTENPAITLSFTVDSTVASHSCAGATGIEWQDAMPFQFEITAQPSDTTAVYSD